MAEKHKEQFIFEQAAIPTAVWTLAVPSIITQLINVIYNYADTWYVGRTGDPDMVAALSVCMPIFVIMAAVANLFGIGGSSVISRSLGEKNIEKARHTFAYCFWGGLMAAVVYALIMLLFRTRIIYLIGGDKDSFAYIYDYIFWTMIIGAVPSVGNVLCGHLVRSIGASKEAGFGMSMGGILNIFLDPLFMFVILPKGMEVTGAAIATCLSNTAAMIYFLILLYRYRDHAVMTVAIRDISVQESIPSEVFAIGLPAALQTTLAMVSNIFANALSAAYGNAAVSGMGIAKKINTLAFNTTMGLTQGVLPLIGYSYGAKNYDRLKATFKFTAVVGLVFNVACVIVFRTFAKELVRFFLDEQASVRYGAMFLRVIAFGTPLASVCYLANTVFQASGRKVQSFLLSVLRKGLLDIPAMFAFRYFLGAIGIVWATPFAEVISTCLAVIMLRSFWKSLQ